MTNQQIIVGFQSNNPAIIQSCYKEIRPLIHTFVLSNTGSEEDATEVVQRCIIVFWQKCQQPHFTLTCQFRTFMYSVARNIWLKNIKQKCKQVDMADLPIVKTMVTIEEEIDKEAGFKTKLHQAIQKLSEEERDLFYCRYVYKMSCQEIAQDLGFKTARAVSDRLYRIKNKLQRWLESGTLY